MNIFTKKISLLGVLLMLFCTGGALAAPPETVQVFTCGIKFNLPAGYKITKPARTRTDYGIKECSVQIEFKSASKPTPAYRPASGECSIPGRPPAGCDSSWYNEYPSYCSRPDGPPDDAICDWAVDHIFLMPAVQVFRAKMTGKKPDLGPFYANDDQQWIVTNAQGTPDLAKTFMCGSYPAWEGEWEMRGLWVRTGADNHRESLSGSYDQPAALIQLAPDIAVVLNGQISDLYPEAGDDAQAHWQEFCKGLGLSSRPQDLP